MPYFALLYDVVDDFTARRSPFRNEHIRRARESYTRGEIVLAGALANPADTALIVFCCATKSTPEEFASKDPYVVNGLVKKWTVRPWTVVVGHDCETSPPGGRLQ